MKTFVDEAPCVVAPYDAPLLHTLDLAKRETNTKALLWRLYDLKIAYYYKTLHLLLGATALNVLTPSITTFSTRALYINASRHNDA